MPLFVVQTNYNRWNDAPGMKLIEAPYAARAIELSGWSQFEVTATPVSAASAAGVVAEFNTAPAPETDDTHDVEDDGDEDDEA